MADVKITYTLVDDITTKAKKIQGSLETMEKTLKNIDDLNKKIGDSKDMANYADQIKKVTGQTGGLNRSLIAVNSKLETQKKKANNSATAVNKLAEKQERLINALEDVNPLVSENSTEMGKAATNAKAYHMALGQVSAKSSNLNRSIEALTPKIETQADAFLRAHLASHAFEQSLDRVVDKEKELRDVMVAKNKEAKLQDKHFQNLDRNSQRAARSLDQTTTSMDKFKRKWNEIQSKDGAFLEGMGMGATQYDLMKKLTILLPMVGTGLGGVGHMAASAGAELGMLIGSVMKLSGALALLPGAYMAAGVAAGSFSAMNKTIFQPAIKGAEELTKLQEDLAKARTAEKPDATRIAELQKDIAETQKSMPKNAEALNKRLKQVKDVWQDIWWGKGGKRADQIIGYAADGLLQLQKTMLKFEPLAGRAADSFGRMVKSAKQIAGSGVVQKNVMTAGNNSFDNLNKFFIIAENLSGVTSAIAANMTSVTGSALGSAVSWSEGYKDAKKIEQASRKTAKYFEEGLDSLKQWGKFTINIGKGMNSLFGGNTAKKFESHMSSKGSSFASWASKISSTQKYADFNANSLKTMDAMGGVLRAIGSALYDIGADPAANKATVDFLHQLSGGIKSFGGFALKAMKELGPAMNDFFKAFGDAHKGTGDVIISVMTKIVGSMTMLVKAVDKVTPDKLLGVVAGITAVMGAMGGILGTAAMATKPVRGAVQIGKATAAGAAVGGAKGGAAGFFGSLVTHGAGKGIDVYVTNATEIGAMAAAPGAVPAITGKQVAKLAISAAAVYLTVTKLIWPLAKDIMGGGPTTGEKNAGKEMNRRAKSSGITQEEYAAELKRNPYLSKNALIESAAARKRSKVSVGGATGASLGRNPFQSTGGALVGNSGKPTKEIQALNKQIGTTPKVIEKAYKDGTAATKTGGDKLKAQTDIVGSKVTGSLSGWAKAVNQIMSSLGAGSVTVPSTPAKGAPTTSTQGAYAGTGGGASAASAKTGDSYYGSGRKGDSAQGSGSKAGGTSFNGHPGNVDPGLLPFIQKAQGTGLSVTSTTDQSKYTKSGNISNHFLGKAVDVSNGSAPTPQMDAFYNMLVPFARSGALSELIYKHNGWQRGSQYNYTGSDHFNHVHFAMGSGGGGAGPLGALAGMAGGLNLPGVPNLGNTAFGQAVQAKAEAARTALMEKYAGGGTAGMPGGEGSSAAPAGDIPSMIAWAASQYGAKADGLLRVAQKESTLNPNAANNWDSNAKAGTPSKGLFQFIQPTYNSMSAQAMAANPAAWAGVSNNWMDPKAQALTAAWAFTHGQGSHWATLPWYGSGGDFMATKPQVIGVGDKQERVTITPKHKMRKGRGGSGGHTIHLNISGLVIADDAGASKLADIVGPKVVEAIISASANASDGEDL